MPKSMVPISLDIPVRHRDMIDKIAMERTASRAQIIRDIIREHFDKKGDPRLPFEGGGS